jgi:hypothetical protein
MDLLPKVAIVYLSYHSDEYLADMIEALRKNNYPLDRIELIIVDNPHPVHGSSAAKITEQILPLSGINFPHITFLPQKENLGFSGGNNVGIAWALEHGFDYIYLHNQDGFMAPDNITKLVEVLEKDKTIGCVQSLIMLHPETDKINSAGNSFSFLGFGYIDHFGQNIATYSLPPVKQIGYASGAGLMMRADLMKKFGMLDEDLFAYHEDVEYSLRLKLAGYSIMLVSGAVFFHKYVFNRSSSKFYLMERNRYAVLLMYYKCGTLVLLLPLLLVMELGLLLLFMWKGWYKEKLKIYNYWLQPRHWRLWLDKRKRIQSYRVISDRQILKMSTAVVSFGDKKDMNNPLLVYFANPLMVIYKLIVQTIVFW